MTISAISHYRGGTIDEVTPVAKKLKAAYSKLGVGYRLSRFQTGPNAGDWFVVVTYARRYTPRCERTPRHSRTSRRATSGHHCSGATPDGYPVLLRRSAR
jgi:hypothetical protein